MNRLVNFVVGCLAVAPASVFAETAQTIYKFVDESGRVTYANAPIKGGIKLALEPLTIMQSSPNAPNVPVASNAPNLQPPPARVIPVAKVVSVPSPSYAAAVRPVSFAPAATVTPPPALAIVAVSAAPPPTTVAVLDANENTLLLAQQRRAEVRQRIVQSEIQAEEKSLGGARAALAAEQRRSGEIRTMRASFAVNAAAATPQKPLISAEARAEIERHFERVRNLQDEVAMHEDNITALREEMVARK